MSKMSKKSRGEDMNKKENYIKLSIYRLHDIRVLLARLFWDHKEIIEDIKLLLFYIYEDWNKVKETIEIWRDIEDKLGVKNK